MLQPGGYFTQDIGYAPDEEGGKSVRRSLAGPFVLTYLDPGAYVEIRAGAIGNIIPPLITELRGLDFRGQFYVCPGWIISGVSKSALLSGCRVMVPPYPADQNGEADSSWIVRRARLME